MVALNGVSKWLWNGCACLRNETSGGQNSQQEEGHDLWVNGGHDLVARLSQKASYLQT